MVEFFIGTICGAIGITVMEVMILAIWSMVKEMGYDSRN